MLRESAWSRTGTPIEIGDLSETESMEYLKKSKIDEESARQLYELVGGRIMELKSVVDKVLGGQPFNNIKQDIFIKVKKTLRTAKIFKNYEYHNVGKRILRASLNSRELVHEAFEEFFNKPDEANEVLGYNVFTYHLVKDTVTFQSCSVKYYVQDNTDVFLRCL
ncbi:hypothetical protein RclHR1_05980001 [Rhizophagus clarus]|uniref:P-loop containing nucleoside triphosphate hydrolase protein n=1 Tax=Rhizophagus clarus TaxID=94130 RepID=A0A2Z6RVT1_9GLOM|nr:hypothetical protein RclHR1_05980001 [Rhizophagus clarus]GES85700.1 P-loop containing nucleoside triphosphate hydrolase protein [Rhizophagus clarus]